MGRLCPGAVLRAHADGEDETEVHAGTDGERREQCADDPSDEPGEAPQAVEGGHDAAAVEAFDADGLCVHRDVVQVGRDAEEYQHGEKLPRFADEAEGHEGSRIEQGREEQHPVASEAADQIAGQGHRRHLPHGDGEQDAAELCLVEIEGLLDVGDAAGPAGEDQPLQEKEACHGESVKALGGLK